MGSNSSKSKSKKMTTPIEITGQHGEKGMYNNVGLQHCFLNVVIQSLWHIGTFRERFIRLSHHQHKAKGLTHDYIGVDSSTKHDHEAHQEHDEAVIVDVEKPAPERQQSVEDGEIPTIDAAEEPKIIMPATPTPTPDQPTLDDPSTCVCCALKLIFIHYEHSDESILPPDTLRFALSLLLDNHGSHKFALKEMSDAEEALDEILKYLHWDAIGAANVPPPNAKSLASQDESEISRSLDVVCAPTCISHTVFGAQLMDQKICTAPRCQASSDPEVNMSFLYRIYVSEIVRMKKLHKDWSLENILKANYLAQSYSCPSPDKTARDVNGRIVKTTCKGPAKIDRWILQAPEVFSMMCVWADAETERTEIQDFFRLIPQRIHLDQFLRVQSDPSQSVQSIKQAYEYQFRGMILYYGRHYVSVFYSTSFQSYVMFDDKRVTRIGDWNAVIERCCKGKLMPTVLFFEATDQSVREKFLKSIATSDQEEQERKQEERELVQRATEQASSSLPASLNVNPTELPPQPVPIVPARPSKSTIADAMSPTYAPTQNQFAASSQPHSNNVQITQPTPASAAFTSSSSSSSRPFTSPPSSASSHSALMSRQPISIIPNYMHGQQQSNVDHEEEYLKWWFHGASNADTTGLPGIHYATRR